MDLYTFWEQLLLTMCAKAFASPARSFCLRTGMKWADHDAKLPDLDRAFQSVGGSGSVPFRTHVFVNPRFDLQANIKKGRIDALLVGSGIVLGETNYGFDPSFVLPLVKAGFELRWSKSNPEGMSVWIPAVKERQAEVIGAVMAIRVTLV